MRFELDTLRFESVTVRVAPPWPGLTQPKAVMELLGFSIEADSVWRFEQVFGQRGIEIDRTILTRGCL